MDGYDILEPFQEPPASTTTQTTTTTKSEVIEICDEDNSAKLSKENEKLKQKIKKLQGTVDNTAKLVELFKLEQKAHQEWKTKCEELQKRVQTVESQMNSRKDEAVKMNSDAQFKNKKILELEKELKQTKLQLDKTKLEKEELQTHVSSMEAQKEEQSDLLLEKDLEIGLLQQEIEQLNREKEDLQKNLSEQTKLVQIQLNESDNTILKDKITVLEQTKSTLESQCRQQKEEVQSLSKRFSRLESENKDLKLQIENETTVTTSLQREIDTLRNALRNASKISSQVTLDELQKENQLLKAKMKQVFCSFQHTMQEFSINTDSVSTESSAETIQEIPPIPSTSPTPSTVQNSTPQEQQIVSSIPTLPQEKKTRKRKLKEKDSNSETMSDNSKREQPTIKPVPKKKKLDNQPSSHPPANSSSSSQLSQQQQQHNVTSMEEVEVYQPISTVPLIHSKETEHQLVLLPMQPTETFAEYVTKVIDQCIHYCKLVISNQSMILSTLQNTCIAMQKQIKQSSQIEEFVQLFENWIFRHKKLDTPTLSLVTQLLILISNKCIFKNSVTILNCFWNRTTEWVSKPRLCLQKISIIDHITILCFHITHQQRNIVEWKKKLLHIVLEICKHISKYEMEEAKQMLQIIFSNCSDVIPKTSPFLKDTVEFICLFFKLDIVFERGALFSNWNLSFSALQQKQNSLQVFVEFLFEKLKQEQAIGHELLSTPQQRLVDCIYLLFTSTSTEIELSFFYDTILNQLLWSKYVVSIMETEKKFSHSVGSSALCCFVILFGIAIQNLPQIRNDNAVSAEEDKEKRIQICSVILEKLCMFIPFEHELVSVFSSELQCFSAETIIHIAVSILRNFGSPSKEDVYMQQYHKWQLNFARNTQLKCYSYSLSKLTSLQLFFSNEVKRWRQHFAHLSTIYNK